MKVIRAEAMGLCFGVRDALARTEQIDRPETVTIHGELVHNDAVLIQLEARGFQSTPEKNRAETPQTPNILITAHGISHTERQRLQAAGKQLIDTTCPLVRRVHQAARVLEADGYHVVVIGRADHVEVQGIVGDLREFTVVGTAEDVCEYPYPKLGVICQTTTPPDLAEKIRAALRTSNRHAEIRTIDTICQPTRDRQQAVERLLRIVDCVVVVGGAKLQQYTATRFALPRTGRAGIPHPVGTRHQPGVVPSRLDGRPDRRNLDA